MALNLWTLDNFKDFETIDKVFFSNNIDCYKNDDEGDLIIGTYPHLFDNKFSEKNFYYTNVDYYLICTI